MCGFAVSDRPGLIGSNSRCQKRGPDLTNIVQVGDLEFLHNLLHITGTQQAQPFQSDGLVMVFNGEIYNYQSLGSYTTDGQSILPLYATAGHEFARYLDGEYAIVIVDFNKGQIILATDSFATKPLWYHVSPQGLCVASYQSQLQGQGFKDGTKMPANQTLVFDLAHRTLLHRITNRRFDLRQHKDTYDDWISAFRASVAKRSVNTQSGMFVGLSSGYDSGAIACELTQQQKTFKAYSIDNNENTTILSARLAMIHDHERFSMSDVEFLHWQQELNDNCEDFVHADEVMSYDIKRDQASMGLAAICHRARGEGRRIYFSGQGADEIMSDYGHDGRKYFKHSEFGGQFPQQLEGFWPWRSFWQGTQIQYLNKEEYVAGHFGIETRYPFLDADLVQEFLWLSADLKNRHYKNALHEYLTQACWPFQPGEKKGFHVTDRKIKQKKASK